MNTNKQADAAFTALGLTVLERGWLSSNSTVISTEEQAWIIDTGYATHAPQTEALVQSALGGRTLHAILNTHLHSDHCGGNARLAERFPQARILIPPGQSELVRQWDTVQLTYEPTGQQCPRFMFDGLLEPGSRIALGSARWEILAAPGHDPHAVLLFQPDHGVLISGDALWENGFGVVFPELEGLEAFEQVGATLELIHELQPSAVIPGHGRAFVDVEGALDRARRRLDQFQRHPERHAEYAAKVLVKFHLLERQHMSMDALRNWYDSTPYFGVVSNRSPNLDLSLEHLVEKLVSSGAARVESGQIFNL